MSNLRVLPAEQAVAAIIVTDLRISPDGSRIAFVTAPASKETEHPESQIWLVSADGGSPRKITTAEASHGALSWSPDSERLAFVSDRVKRGVGQLHVLAVGGGEAVRLTDSETGVSEAQWSPDGSKIAFTMLDSGTDPAAPEDETSDHRVVDAGTRQAGLYVIDVPVDAATVFELPAPRRVSPQGVHVGTYGGGGYVWMRDSSGFAAAFTRSPKAQDCLRPEMVLLSLDGEISSLDRHEGLRSPMEFSPDGTSIVVNATEGTLPAMFVLVKLSTAGERSTVLLPGYPGSFYSHGWLSEDRLLAGVETGQTHTFIVINLRDGSVQPAVEGLPPGTGAFPLSVSADGRRFAFTWASDHSHADIYVGEVGGSARRLTGLNPWVRDYTWGEVREVTWSSVDGLEIQGLLILPVGYKEGKRCPLVTQLHGGPMGAWTRRLYTGCHACGHTLSQRGYAVFLPNPRGSSGRGTKFLCGIVGCYGEPDFHDIMSGIDYLIAEGIADPGQLVVGGASGGGFLTNWCITHSDRFKAAITQAGISNWISFQGTTDIRDLFDSYYVTSVDEDPGNHWAYSPIRYIKNATTPTLILHGEVDARVPVTQSYELYEGLKSLGVETQLVVYPGEPHGIRGRNHQLDIFARVNEWYDRHLDRKWEEREA